MMNYKEFLQYLWESGSSMIVIFYIGLLIISTILYWRDWPQKKGCKRVLSSLAYSIIVIVLATLIAVVLFLYCLGR